MIRKESVMVLDTSAAIMGYNPLTINKKQYTVPEVLRELTPDTTVWLRFKVAEECGKLHVQGPFKRFKQKIRDLSLEVGDMQSLSDADRQVLALALQLKEEGMNPVIVSDDYSIQNVADQLGIDYTSLATFGIRYRFHWIRYCPACNRKYSHIYLAKNCRFCGTQLKRKVFRKMPLLKWKRKF